MIEKDYDLNDIVEMKKEHPCHKSKYWKLFLLMMVQQMRVVACVMQSLNKMTGCQYFIKRMKDCHKHEMME